ncbi:MAG: hypothetical protein KDB07_08055 [Planctomycetes bacterium]|nr:hypothetical protein [Planctomycetota bacterium]
MSFEGLFTAIYRLYYKEGVRDAFMSDGSLDLPLSDQERGLLERVDQTRLATIIELHANDIWAGWYANRFGASWEALRLILGFKSNAELVRKLCNSDAFEKRINDDRFGDALEAFIFEERLRNPEGFANAPWLADLFEYERLLTREIGDEFEAALGRFAHRVDHLAQLERPWAKLPKVGKLKGQFLVLVGASPAFGISEIEVADELCFAVLSRLLGAERPEEALIAKADKKKLKQLEEECAELLEEMAEG